MHFQAFGVDGGHDEVQVGSMAVHGPWRKRDNMAAMRRTTREGV